MYLICPEYIETCFVTFFNLEMCSGILITLNKYFFDKSKRFGTYASAFFDAMKKTDKNWCIREEGVKHFCVV